MWSRVYVVIVLGMVGYKGQELAAVRRRSRLLATGCYVLGQEYVLFLGGACFIFGLSPFGSTAFDFRFYDLSIDDFLP